MDKLRTVLLQSDHEYEEERKKGEGNVKGSQQKHNRGHYHELKRHKETKQLEVSSHLPGRLATG